MDLESLDKWEAYTHAKEQMFLRTDTDFAPWITIKSNDKKRPASTRCGTSSHGSTTGKDAEVVGTPDPGLVKRGIDAVGD